MQLKTFLILVAVTAAGVSLAIPFRGAIAPSRLPAPAESTTAQHAAGPARVVPLALASPDFTTAAKGDKPAAGLAGGSRAGGTVSRLPAITAGGEDSAAEELPLPQLSNDYHGPLDLLGLNRRTLRTPLASMQPRTGPDEIHPTSTVQGTASTIQDPAEETPALATEGPVTTRTDEGTGRTDVKAAAPHDLPADQSPDGNPPATEPVVPREHVALQFQPPPPLLSVEPVTEAAADPSTAAPAPPTAHGAPRRHAVVDGETLPGLAAKYLGDPSRADELFNRNRDVLDDPRLLPIGAVLKIDPE